MVQSQSFVRSVEVSDDRIPCVILYTDRQLRDIKSFCFDARRGSVLGFDKTFNLGSMYVTVSTYQNLALNRSATGNTPAFFGPMFIHGKSDADTYNKFFSRLASKLQDMDFHQLRLGLDDEYAMRKSLKFCFSGASLLACSRHLKTNTQHCAVEAGVSPALRSDVLNSLFGDEGLVSCGDVAQFECAVDRLHTKLLTLQMPDKLRTYVSNRIVNFLRNNVTAGCHGWTNNACESLNHILKLSVQWRPHKLPDLIEKLHKVVDAQYVEADRALLGYGDFVLRPEYAQHRVTPQEWKRMTMAQKAKAQDHCFRLPSCANNITSTDGTLTVNGAPSRGRKPHQRKRPASEKTTSTPKRQR